MFGTNRDRREISRQLMNAFIRMAGKYQSMEKYPLQFGRETSFYHSERHMLEVFARYPELNVTDLAGKVGVTKGAISQIVGKLEKKGAVERCKDGLDDKQVRVRLTELGREITAHVRQVNEQTVDHLYDLIKDKTDKEVTFLCEMFEWIEGHLDEGLKLMQSRHGK